MKRKSATRSALITSIISLLLCVSMLVGTTFAWFTDEVVTGMNTIAAGNLDVELLADGVKVNSETKLFDDVTLWEPGVVTYEKLKVANVGTLALEYQMTMNFGNENDLNGHKLSEVLQVAVIDGSEVDMTDRAEVLAAAQAATETEVGAGLLANFNVTGKLLPKTESDEMTVVIFWAPNDNAKDNLYNANNGQETSDKQPLHIEFGVKLQATQMVHEEDSFDNKYDMGVDNTPMASIVPLGSKAITATAGIGGAASDITLDAAYQYEPTLTFEEVQESAYKYYKADFFVYADKTVPANSLALAGYYDAWCQYNNDNWVALAADVDVEGGAENGVRLIEAMGGGSIAVHYKDICQYGNDGIGFLCGLVDLTGQNAGTTITVELRLYATDADPAGSSASDKETGEYFTVATAKYTFPAAEIEDLTDLGAAAEMGITIDANGANLGDFYYDAKFADGTVLKNAEFDYFYGGNVEGTVTFENCTFTSDHSYCANFDSGNGEIIFKNCTFDGWSSFGTAITNVRFENCTFKKSFSYGVLRFYQTAQLFDCTFEAAFEGVDTNVTGYKVEFTNCTGLEGKIYNNGSNKGIWVVDGVDISDTVTSW